METVGEYSVFPCIPSHSMINLNKQLRLTVIHEGCGKRGKWYEP